jgi:mannan endo-1,4-beta-mannosidase
MSFWRKYPPTWLYFLVAALVASAFRATWLEDHAEAATVTTTTDDASGACSCTCACQVPPAPVCAPPDASVTDARETGPIVKDATALDVLAEVLREADVRDAGAPPDASSGPCGVARPSWNTGSGFFVLGSKLYDANGCEFRIRGFNVNHLDSVAGNMVGLNNANPAAVRLVYDIQQYGYSDAQVNGFVQGYINNKIVAIPGNWQATCTESAGSLTTIVSFWKARVAWLKSIERYSLLNIANEFGASDSTAWRDQYISAIQQLRAAGVTNTLVIDAGGCGQDAPDLIKYGAAVAASDPQRNVVLDAHIYGQYCVNPGCQSWQQELTSSLNAFAQIGAPILLGEFGPGRNVGPSPTTIAPAAVIQGAESRGFGWLAWSVDDPAYNADDSSFALMKNAGVSSYQTSSSADLTTFGKDVIENSSYGLKILAKRATVFP